MTNAELEDLIANHVSQLMEHFSSVQIVATLVTDKNTVGFKRGAGDWYARIGMAREFLIRDKAITEEDAIHPSEEE